MAWIRRAKALSVLLDFARARCQKVRVLCGVNGFLTEPEALSAIRSCCDLKIAYGTAGIKFHTKMFVFHEPALARLWIGSANLTESAFSTNREGVSETVDDGSGVRLFKRYWAEFNSPDDAWINDYATAYAGLSASSKQVEPPHPKSQPVAPAWNSYVQSLRRKNSPRLDWIANQLGEVTSIALKD